MRSDRTLIVTVDTEESFDWTAGPSTGQQCVDHIAELPRLQDLFDELGVRPTYLVDYPVMASDDSAAVLRGLREQGRCEIGAHLHPWVNPPIDEEVCRRNSYLSNLPLELQRRKLSCLTAKIKESVGIAPTSFRAGRFGIDFRLVPHLAQLGYTVESSVLPYHDLTIDGGPNFSEFRHEPFRFPPANTDGETVFEIPVTAGFSRAPFEQWSRWRERMTQSPLRGTRIIGLLWHLRILRRIQLSPECAETRDLLTLMKLLARQPRALLHVTLHSPSIQPGNTPFCRTQYDVDSLLRRLRTCLQFAIDELDAASLTLSEYAGTWLTQEAPIGDTRAECNLVAAEPNR